MQKGEELEVRVGSGRQQLLTRTESSKLDANDDVPWCPLHSSSPNRLSEHPSFLLARSDPLSASALVLFVQPPSRRFVPLPLRPRSPLSRHGASTPQLLYPSLLLLLPPPLRGSPPSSSFPFSPTLPPLPGSSRPPSSPSPSSSSAVSLVSPNPASPSPNGVP